MVRCVTLCVISVRVCAARVCGSVRDAARNPVYDSVRGSVRDPVRTRDSVCAMCVARRVWRDRLEYDLSGLVCVYPSLRGPICGVWSACRVQPCVYMDATVHTYVILAALVSVLTCPTERSDQPEVRACWHDSNRGWFGTYKGSSPPGELIADVE